MSDTKWDSNGAVTYTDGENPTGASLNDTLEIGCPPIGTICGWSDNITGTPSLPGSWVLCDGSTVSDSESPLNGQTLPDLNGNNYFLRAGSTSGGTGGALTHAHGTVGAQADSGSSGFTSATHTPSFIEFKMVIRIK